MEAKEDFAKTVEEELGYQPVVVRVNSEYVLEKDEVVDMSDAMRDDVDVEMLNDVRTNLYDIHRRIEDILYNAKLAVGEDMSSEKLSQINNMVLELKKSTINLGAAVTDNKKTENSERNQ